MASDFSTYSCATANVTNSPLRSTSVATSAPTPLGHAPAKAISDLLQQMEMAFGKAPNVARVLHGERRIHQGGRGRRTALFPSRKCGGTVPLESRLELAHAVALERSPSVREYRTQAICIPLPGGRFAFPDFLVRTTAGEIEVHEVKPSIEHLSPTDTQRFATIRALLSEIGVRLRLIDSRNLPSGRELDDLLYRFSRGHVQPYTCVQIELAASALSAQGLGSFAEAYVVLERLDLPARLADYLNFHQQWKSTPAQNAPRIQRGS